MPESAVVTVRPNRAVAEVEAGLAELDAGQGISETEADILFDQLEG